ncbi:hypothetical protein DPMN_048178 [Dreissena polymorpha]|uniref:Uncharacterized protein n=1 Tax=Dreissena polymorpha TaxID=45954 RepID=A0A9D4DCV0_DREPO|nr:hypothetical protein DPMN_048178 [Dreissena polymorpha]
MSVTEHHSRWLMCDDCTRKVLELRSDPSLVMSVPVFRTVKETAIVLPLVSVIFQATEGSGPVPDMLQLYVAC